MVEKDVKNSFDNVESNLLTQRLGVEGASCASCVRKIETALGNVVGVEKAEMNLAQGTE